MNYPTKSDFIEHAVLGTKTIDIDAMNRMNIVIGEPSGKPKPDDVLIFVQFLNDTGFYEIEFESITGDAWGLTSDKFLLSDYNLHMAEITGCLESNGYEKIEDYESKEFCIRNMHFAKKEGT
jgi:hypothetical protein